MDDKGLHESDMLGYEAITNVVKSELQDGVSPVTNKYNTHGTRGFIAIYVIGPVIL